MKKILIVPIKQTITSKTKWICPACRKKTTHGRALGHISTKHPDRKEEMFKNLAIDSVWGHSKGLKK
jgi:hypothetical protein